MASVVEKANRLELLHTKTVSSEQYSYAKKKTRHAMQPSKKLDCPASIIVKEVLKFTPEEGSSSELDKKWLLLMIMKLHRYIDHDWQMTSINFQITSSGMYGQTLTETDTEEGSRVREIHDMYARANST
ncbi:hypothetical protein DPMN_124248 [Dreissena polymorpha]|uniref:Uncharacterized protein n=1 Tax=Dreissena polymorpha TaxID=45954 RepID=A0A9D4JTN6_DREPO|nr:hypothetical protein DPMN_124248 [Dreissena polymorpha]